MKKRILILLGILIIGGAAGGVGWKMGIFGQQEESSEMAYVTKISDLTGDISGVTNRYAGVVEPQETVEVELENGRAVKEVKVKTGDEVKQGQLLFQYDLTSIQEDLDEAQLELDRLKNEASSLSEQIATLEKEKKQAQSDEQLSYTIEIETNRMNLKKNEYSQKSKQAEITKLQNTMGNTEVRSSIDGVIQKIDTSKMQTSDDSMDELATGDSYSYSDDLSSGSGSNAFITILSTGAYRIKGTVNEMNADSIIEGQAVIVRSRVDEDQTWKGIMGSVDRESAESQSSSSYSWGMMDASGDSQTSSSTYPFYVELTSSEGLMLGQHVYIEMDEGQEDKKEGLWLSEFYIVDADTNSPYVWAADGDGRLEKRSVILGQYDEALGEYEIADGLSKKDSIAYPSELLKEGMKTTTNSAEAIDMNPVEDGTDISEELPAEDGTVTEDDMMDADPGMAEEDIVYDEGTVEGTMDDTVISDEGAIADESTMMDEGAVFDDTEASSSEVDMSADPAMMNEGPVSSLPEDEVLVPAEGEMG